MIEEIWKDIPSYEGIYQVSNLGNVKRIDKTKEKILKPRAITNGYLGVDLYINNKPKHRLVHTLVMEAFVGSKPDNMEICHNDGNKKNNKLDNLRYDSHSNNIIDEVKSNRHHFQKLSADDVLEIRKLLNDTNLTSAEIGRMYNIDSSTVRKIKARKNWSWLMI